ncbi:MAG: pilus assembly protein [Chloroflexi bacterium]|nr:pilus assembly protein [Chloroflexota bacterium]
MFSREPILHARRGEKGQNLIEFALVAPILILLVMGIADFGRAFNAWLSVTHGAREGARYAAVGNTDVVNHVKSIPGLGDATVVFNPAPKQGESLSVSVSLDVELITGIIANNFFGGNTIIPLNSSAIMRYEGPKI